MIQSIIGKAERVCEEFEYNFSFTVYYEYDGHMIEFTLFHQRFKFNVVYSIEYFLSTPVKIIVDQLAGAAKIHIWEWYGLK